MIKIGVVGTTGGWSSELLTNTVEELTGYHLLIDMKEISLDLDNGKLWYRGIDLAELDALMIKKIGSRYSPLLLDRLELLRYLEEKGIKIYSSPLKVLRVLDRLSCTITLRSAEIPMPPTTITENIGEAVEAVRMYKEAVFKPLYTSKARGMVVIGERDDIPEKVKEFKQNNDIMYIQKKIDLRGRDLGIAFLGGEYLTTYARHTNGSWNTTTRSGGKYAACDPDESTIQLAKKAQDLFGLDFTCVDVAETKEGPMVFEVSAFGGFRGIQTARGMNAANLFVRFVLNRIGK
jgi:ribosomal protein S6--L-glutamate ligase